MENNDSPSNPFNTSDQLEENKNHAKSTLEDSHQSTGIVSLSLDGKGVQVAESTLTKQDHLMIEDELDPASLANEYRLKKIVWDRQDGNPPKAVAIITQNANGPCPLLALCKLIKNRCWVAGNVLLLRGDIYLNPDRPVVTFEHLVQIIGEYLLTIQSNQANDKEHEFEQKLEDILRILPTLQTGLDVNVLFTSPFGFESSPALSLFGVFGIALCHGWLPDPQTPEIYKIVAETLGSYNRVVERVIEGKDENASENVVHEGLVCEAFLNDTSGQLTYHGLQQLSETIQMNQLAVLFRNNHFSTIFKHASGHLYSLVTDVGYHDQSNVVWETIDNIEGDSQYVDSAFKLFRPTETIPIHQEDTVLPSRDEQSDFALAVQLQREEELSQRRNMTPAVPIRPQTASSSTSSKAKKADKCIIQ